MGEEQEETYAHLDTDAQAQYGQQASYPEPAQEAANDQDDQGVYYSNDAQGQMNQYYNTENQQQMSYYYGQDQDSANFFNNQGNIDNNASYDPFAMQQGAHAQHYYPGHDGDINSYSTQQHSGGYYNWDINQYQGQTDSHLKQDAGLTLDFGEGNNF